MPIEFIMGDSYYADISPPLYQFSDITLCLEKDTKRSGQVIFFSAVMTSSTEKKKFTVEFFVSDYYLDYLGWPEMITKIKPMAIQELRAELPEEARVAFDDMINGKTPAVNYPQSSAEELSKSLPGLNQMIIHPVHNKRVSLRSAIMSLNDVYKWSRERIADWLEEISDPTGANGPDIRFQLEATQ